MTGHSPSGHGQHRGDRLLKELEHDPYHARKKLKEPTACPSCGAVYHQGRWVWDKAPAGAHEELCPACHRAHDKVPAAYLTLSGAFLAAHQNEIMHLITNYEAREKAEHPLKRVMSKSVQDDKIEFTFTDAHLAHGIGEALRKAYDGELEAQHTDEDIMLRVYWRRD